MTVLSRVVVASERYNLGSDDYFGFHFYFSCR